MKRDITQALLSWKSSSRRKPLILDGARQVGKTHALTHFGEVCYDDLVYLNFERDEMLFSFFDSSLDPKKIVEQLSIHFRVDIQPEKTLLFFDEVQECPRALNSLKYFCEEANEYHVVAAGSLLGIKVGNRKGFPVGKVNFLHLFPFNFFEFLAALGEEKLAEFLRGYHSVKPIADPFHEKLIEYLRRYFYVGGMPEAVATYAETGRFHSVRDVHYEILDAYERDFAKHAPPEQVMKIVAVWKQVHQQLAKENKKFVFSAIRKSARGRDYEYAIQWLIDAGLLYKSVRISAPKLPLSAYSNSNIFKLFMLDVGLLSTKSLLDSKTLVDGNRLFVEFKGALTENYVAQAFTSKGERQLYYWTSEGKAEIDFLLEDDRGVYPVEVKAGVSTKQKSLTVYFDKYLKGSDTAYPLVRSSLLNFAADGRLVNYPLYAVSLVPKLNDDKAS